MDNKMDDSAFNVNGDCILQRFETKKEEEEEK